MYVTGYSNKYGKYQENIMTAFRRVAEHSTMNPDSNLIHIPNNMKSQEYFNILANHSTSYGESLRNILSVSGQHMSQKIRHDFLSCALQHPGTTSCLLGSFVSGRAVLRQALNIYLPLNGLTLFSGLGIYIYRYHIKKDMTKKLRSPKMLFKRFIISTVRACIFLMAYVGIFSYSLCVLRRLTGRELKISYTFNNVLATGSLV